MEPAAGGVTEFVVTDADGTPITTFAITAKGDVIGDPVTQAEVKSIIATNNWTPETAAQRFGEGWKSGYLDIGPVDRYG